MFTRVELLREELCAYLALSPAGYLSITACHSSQRLSPVLLSKPRISVHTTLMLSITCNAELCSLFIFKHLRLYLVTGLSCTHILLIAFSVRGRGVVTWWYIDNAHAGHQFIIGPKYKDNFSHSQLWGEHQLTWSHPFGLRAEVRLPEGNSHRKAIFFILNYMCDLSVWLKEKDDKRLSWIHAHFLIHAKIVDCDSLKLKESDVRWEGFTYINQDGRSRNTNRELPQRTGEGDKLGTRIKPEGVETVTEHAHSTWWIWIQVLLAARLQC